jgi:anti-anti-sigma factor
VKLSITSDASGALHFAGALDIYGADAAREALIVLVREHAAPVLDLQAVETSDAAGVQLLCSANKSAAQSGKRLTFFQPSPALILCCESLGCPAVFFS